jgi:hypothetical protein
MGKGARLALWAGLILTAIGLAAGLYYFTRLSVYVPNCNFCVGRPVPPDVRMLGYISSIVFSTGLALTACVLVTEVKARRQTAKAR